MNPIVIRESTVIDIFRRVKHIIKLGPLATSTKDSDRASIGEAGAVRMH